MSRAEQWLFPHASARTEEIELPANKHNFKSQRLHWVDIRAGWPSDPPDLRQINSQPRKLLARLQLLTSNKHLGRDGRGSR